MSPRAREVTARLALLAGALVSGLLVAEIAVRAFGLAPERFSRTGRMVDAGWTLLLDCYPTNPRGYFDLDLRDPRNRARYLRVAPNRFDAVARRAPYAVEFRYNALRFRDAPFGPRRPGVRRVMVLGDSFTEGQGVKEPDTLARVLEGLLNADEPGRWEVLNCGRRGADFPALYEAFEDVLPYGPDLLIYAMVLNDADQSEAFHGRQAFLNDSILDGLSMAEAGEARPRGFFTWRLPELVSDRVRAWRVGRETTRWYLDMYGAPNRAGWERTERSIREMHRRLEERGARFLLVNWPLLVDLGPRYPFASVHETIGRFCAAAGIPRYDLLEAFRGQDAAALWVHPVDHHPNEVAQRQAAASLVPVVRGLGVRP